MAGHRYMDLNPPLEQHGPPAHLMIPAQHRPQSEAELLSLAPRNKEGRFISERDLYGAAASDIATDISKAKIIEGRPALRGLHLNEKLFDLREPKPFKM